MKTQKLFKKTGIMILVAACMFFFQSFIYEGDLKEKNPGSVSSKVNYVGEEELFFLFEVIVTDEDSSSNNNFRINIRANNTDEIFEGTYKPGEGKRIFKIAKADIEKISFGIYSKRKTVYYHFDVKRFYEEHVKVVPVNLS